MTLATRSIRPPFRKKLFQQIATTRRTLTKHLLGFSYDGHSFFFRVARWRQTLCLGSLQRCTKDVTADRPVFARCSFREDAVLLGSGSNAKWFAGWGDYAHVYIMYTLCI
jgi:hypothetical protein